MGCGQSKINLYPRRYKNGGKGHSAKKTGAVEKEAEDEEGSGAGGGAGVGGCAGVAGGAGVAGDGGPGPDGDEALKHTVPLTARAPTIQVSESQRDFFKMLDEKIDKGRDYDSGSESELVAEHERRRRLLDEWRGASAARSPARRARGPPPPPRGPPPPPRRAPPARRPAADYDEAPHITYNPTFQNHSPARAPHSPPRAPPAPSPPRVLPPPAEYRDEPRAPERSQQRQQTALHLQQYVAMKQAQQQMFSYYQRAPHTVYPQLELARPGSAPAGPGRARGDAVCQTVSLLRQMPVGQVVLGAELCADAPPAGSGDGARPLPRDAPPLYSPHGFMPHGFPPHGFPQHGIPPSRECRDADHKKAAVARPLKNSRSLDSA